MPDYQDDLSERRPDSLLRADIIGELVGVIDLHQGNAVHAVAGVRADYRSVHLQGRAADPEALANHYGRLGLRRLYVADLDGIERGAIQSPLLERLLADADRWQEILLDLGGGDAMDPDAFAQMTRFLERSEADYKLILATESIRSIEILQRIAHSVSPNRLLLGLDYRAGVLISQEQDERRWVEAARRSGIEGAVVLDVASVGTADSTAAAQHCSRIKSIDATIQLYSGGGISSALDIQMLRKSGCERFLVATALHGLGVGGKKN